MAKGMESATRMLLLVGDRIGANCMMGGKKLSILDKFARFGWEVTLAGVEDHVEPCPFAAKRGAMARPLDTTVDAIGDLSAYDGISVLPGTSFQGLIAVRSSRFAVGNTNRGFLRGLRAQRLRDLRGESLSMIARGLWNVEREVQTRSRFAVRGMRVGRSFVGLIGFVG
jgi:hypothetical protein